MQPLTEAARRWLRWPTTCARNCWHRNRAGISARRCCRGLKHFRSPRTCIPHLGSGQQTVMEVQAQDRPGLLHQVACALQQCQTRLVTAKVATYGERARTTSSSPPQRRAIAGAEQQERLRQEILTRLGGSADAAADAVSRSITF